MNNRILFVSLFLISLSGFSQNPYKYESKVITLVSKNVGFGSIETKASSGGFKITTGGVVKSFEINGGNSSGNLKMHKALEFVQINLNDNGYSLKSTAGNVSIEGEGSLTLFFEKSSSYREAELYKLINELTTRIDETSRKYTDSAIVVIHTNVLNYLKSIPNEVITQAYKDELTKKILSEAEDKIKKVIEELKKEIRSSSTGN